MSTSGTGMLAAGLIGIAVWLMTPPPASWLLFARLGTRPEQRRSRARLLDRVRSAAGRLLRRSRREESALVVEACEVIALELRAGRPPAHALEAGAEVLPAMQPAAAAARAGGDVAEALRSLAGVDREVGRSLAGAWLVAEQIGAGPAAVVECVVQSLRFEDAVRREVASQLAGPRGTARLLAMLPLLGLVIGGGFGDPMMFLFGTPYGLACLGSGVLLAAAGVWWIELLARRAERLR